MSSCVKKQRWLVSSFLAWETKKAGFGVSKIKSQVKGNQRYNYKYTIDKTDRKDRVAPEGTWVHGGGIEIPCIYFLYWAKVHESNV